MPALSEENRLYILFLRIHLDITSVLVVTGADMLERWVLEEKLQFCPSVCEYIAIPVILVFLFLIILNNRFFSVRIACYVRFCTIVLNVSVVIEDMSPTMLIKIHLNPQPSHTPTHSSTRTTQPQTPPPYQHPNNNPNAAAKSNPHANKYHPPNDNPY